MSSLPKFEQVSALVIGDIMLDRYWSGSANRISPEAPVPVVHVGDTETRPGGAANVALNMSGLGCHVGLCGIIGDDEAGQSLTRTLDSANIENHLITSDSNSTIVKLRVISQHQQLLRLDFEELQGSVELESLQESYVKALDQCDIVVLSDYAKGTLSEVEALIENARDRGIKVLVDPKGSDFDRYRGATLITPNRKELEQVVGTCSTLEELFSKAQNLRNKLDFDAIVVTLSEDGMALISESKIVHVPTEAREVFDVTGAGDTVISALAATLGAGEEFETAIRLANKAAGIAVGKLGTATVSAAELTAALAQEHLRIESGIVTEQELVGRARKKQSGGSRIVFTNGCFDILHPGHVRYLEQAAALGDRLVVAVNSDRSVRELKGNERPINGLDDRMTMLASLRSVDWVVSFDESTPERLITELLPDVLVKGGDYLPDQIAGHQAVTENGGEVIVMEFVDGHSTSTLIERIKSLAD